jgi:hypothetical protein
MNRLHNPAGDSPHVQQTSPRVTPSARFLVAAAAAAAIAVTGTTVVGQQLRNVDANDRRAAIDGAVTSGAAWETQRAQQSADGLNLQRIRAFIASNRFSQMGAAWQERYEQTSVHGIQRERQRQIGADWQERYEQMYPSR